ncbi:rCG39935 [Rattus norvegicus]|uniref:RCG39935 n=1 Tax=Rattus norvegicus TaxID=10116 RepID=A6IA40_RAT|nr:rCG39935 [Rattus norvegicus]
MSELLEQPVISEDRLKQEEHLSRIFPCGKAYLSLTPLCCLDTAPQNPRREAKGLETHGPVPQ